MPMLSGPGFLVRRAEARGGSDLIRRGQAEACPLCKAVLGSPHIRGRTCGRAFRAFSCHFWTFSGPNWLKLAILSQTGLKLAPDWPKLAKLARTASFGQFGPV